MVSLPRYDEWLAEKAAACSATRAEQLRKALLEALTGDPPYRRRDAVAAMVGTSAATADAALARLAREGLVLHGEVLRLHHGGCYLGPGGDLYEGLQPSAFAIESWAAAGAYAQLDVALAASAPAEGPRLDAAPLCWNDGTELSAGAQRWYLHHLLGERLVERDRSGAQPVRGAADRVDPALSLDSRRDLGLFLAGTDLAPGLRRRLPSGCEQLIDWLGIQVGAAMLDLPFGTGSHIDGYVSLHAPDAVRRQLLWHHVHGGAGAHAVEGLWPRGDDPTGGVDQWRARIVAGLEGAMVSCHAWTLDELRERYLAHPVAKPVLLGVVFVAVSTGEPVVFDLRGRPMPALAGETQVRVADARDRRSRSSWPRALAPPPFSQTGRPSERARQAAAVLPEVPELPALPEPESLS